VSGHLHALPKLDEVVKLTTGLMIGTDKFWMIVGRLGIELKSLDLQIKLETKNRSLDVVRLLQSCPNLHELKIELILGKYNTEGVTDKMFKHISK
jgi:hypothetical protein